MYTIGLSKIEINVPLLPVAMMGYGDWDNRVKSQFTKLNVRALVIKSAKKKLIFVNAEMLMITPKIRREVLVDLTEKHTSLNIQSEDVMLTAQHTHSAPSGYSDYAFYNFTTPGFCQEVFDGYKNAIVTSIVEAHKEMFKGTLSIKKGLFGLNEKVAWNRSIKAYNNNPEVDKITEQTTAKGIDREMKLLEVKDSSGNLKGSINWFGVHTTSIGPKNTKISFENKGYAAQFLEEEHTGSIHMFAQGKSGDVSPHYHGPKQLKVRKEVAKNNDHEYAKQNGAIQYKKANEIIKADGVEVSGELKSILSFQDFSNKEVLPEFANGDKAIKTSDACIGLAMLKGTPVDGPGIGKGLSGVVKGINGIVNKKQKHLNQGEKVVMINASTCEFMGTGKMNVLPGFLDPQIGATNKMYKNGSLNEHTLVPTILPSQIFIIGSLAIVGVAGEITTTAGKRLEESITNQLASQGIKEVILSPYANCYMGYITTPEEYRVQNYEGGHTVYGPHTLGAFQTVFNELAIEIGKKPSERILPNEVEQPIFSKVLLAKRSYPFK